MHQLIVRMKAGGEIVVMFEGPEGLKVRNWWVTDNEDGPRPVDVAVHTYLPVQSSGDAVSP